MISSGGRVCQRLVEVGLQAVALAVDDAPLQPLVQRQRGQFLGPGGARRRLRVDALEQLQEALQRVVGPVCGARS